VSAAVPSAKSPQISTTEARDGTRALACGSMIATRPSALLPVDLLYSCTGIQLAVCRKNRSSRIPKLEGSQARKAEVDTKRKNAPYARFNHRHDPRLRHQRSLCPTSVRPSTAQFVRVLVL
jgi:hypothetical protein